MAERGFRLILTSSPNLTQSYPIHTTPKPGIDTPTPSTILFVTTTRRVMYVLIQKTQRQCVMEALANKQGLEIE
jgi:hypothetical protein